MSIDFGPASKGIGVGMGMIGMGIGLKFMSDTVKNMEMPRSSKSKPYTPLYTEKNTTSKQYSFKPLKWKL